MTLKDIFSDLAIDFGLVEDRAGRYPRHLARGRQKAFIQAHRRVLLVILVVGVAAVGLTELLPSWARNFVAGAWLASLGWLLVFIVVQLSGTASTMMGTMAEQWTAQELRRLRRRGWRVISHITPRYGDVDHIVVGPGGLLVVESKWRSDPRAFDDGGWLSAECRKLAENARLIRLSLKPQLQSAPTNAVFVHWDPGPASDSHPPDEREVCGVKVIAGPGFPSWLDSLVAEPSQVMNKASIDSAWETLAKLARTTDRRDFKVTGVAPTMPMRHLLNLGIGVVVGLGAFPIASLLFRWQGPALFFPVVTVLSVGGFVTHRSNRLPVLGRIVGLGATVGFGLCLAVMVVLYAYAGVVRS